MKLRKWSKFGLLLTVAVVLMAVPFTLAYLFRETDTVVNTFQPPAGLSDELTVDIAIQKQMVNTGNALMAPSGFTFVLKNEATGIEQLAVSDDQGMAHLVLGFDGSQAGNTYQYVLTEQNDHRPGVTYSNAVYAIAIEVYLADGQAHTRLFVNGTPVEQIAPIFVNEYDGSRQPIIPPTGDAAPVALLMALAVVSAGILPVLWKRRKAANG